MVQMLLLVALFSHGATSANAPGGQPQLSYQMQQLKIGPSVVSPGPQPGPHMPPQQAAMPRPASRPAAFSSGAPQGLANGAAAAPVQPATQQVQPLAAPGPRGLSAPMVPSSSGPLAMPPSGGVRPSGIPPNFPVAGPRPGAPGLAPPRPQGAFVQRPLGLQGGIPSAPGAPGLPPVPGAPSMHPVAGMPRPGLNTPAKQQPPMGSVSSPPPFSLKVGSTTPSPTKQTAPGNPSAGIPAVPGFPHHPQQHPLAPGPPLQPPSQQAGVHTSGAITCMSNNRYERHHLF